MPRILAISDEIDRSLSVERLREIAPDIVVSCGDLPAGYLERIADATNRRVLFVPGNHDPDLTPVKDRYARSAASGDSGVSVGVPSFESLWEPDDRLPAGGENLDLVVAETKGLRIAGVGGSIRYRPGPNQYTDREMAKRVRRLVRRARRGRRGAGRLVDIVIAHSPPRDVGDGPDDPHRGFSAFHDLVASLRPRYLLHGHVHPHGFDKPDRAMGDTTVVNVIPHRVLEI
ncbi:MAG TPA: metallophosphoesterase [Acidimicrobiia bacterium]|nr:metallophosphoesterase [Acidimicrobiia bacterium]